MYTIKETSDLTHIPIPTLRYYEELGLLIPSRKKNNYRAYSNKDIDWIQFIKRIKATGMNLEEIKMYSNLRNQGDTTISDRLALLDTQEKKLKEQLIKTKKDIKFIQDKKILYEKMLHSKK